jgi:hypothetical protein
MLDNLIDASYTVCLFARMPKETKTVIEEHMKKLGIVNDILTYRYLLYILYRSHKTGPDGIKSDIVKIVENILLYNYELVTEILINSIGISCEYLLEISEPIIQKCGVIKQRILLF